MDARGLLVVLMKLDTVLRICLIIFVIFVSQAFEGKTSFNYSQKSLQRLRRKKRPPCFNARRKGERAKHALKGRLSVVRSAKCRNVLVLSQSKRVGKVGCDVDERDRDVCGADDVIIMIVARKHIVFRLESQVHEWT